VSWFEIKKTAKHLSKAVLSCGGFASFVSDVAPNPLNTSFGAFFEPILRQFASALCQLEKIFHSGKVTPLNH